MSTRRLPPLIPDALLHNADRVVSTVRRSAVVRRVARRRIVAGFVAMCVAVAVVQTVGQASAERRRWGRSVQVLVATVDLPAGAAVTAATTRLEQRPMPVLPDDVVRELPSNARATVAIGRGEAVVSGRLSGQGDQALAPRIPRGRSAVSLQLGGLQPNVQAGDLVDVLAPEEQSGPVDPSDSELWTGARVETIADDAVVLEIDDDRATLAVRNAQVRSAAAAALHGLVTIVVTG